MGEPAARVGDKHVCPCPTPKLHEGGPIVSKASQNVDTNTKEAARATDQADCTPVGLKNFIVTGSTTVEINGKLAARKTDFTMHPGPGTIVEGSDNVEIGGPRGGAILGKPDEAGKRCRAAAKGRKSKKTAQSYNNCGVESARQLLNENGNGIGEDALLDDALKSGDASTEATRFDSGGTSPDGRNNILNSHGLPSHTTEGGIDNIVQNVAEGKGVISSHDANILWYDKAQPEVAGHAIVPTGAEYDENGKLKNVIFNDTGTGNCQQSMSADQFTRSLRAGRDLNVTDKPLW